MSDRQKYRPPTPEEIAADLAAIVPGPERPFVGVSPWPPGSGHHDEATCSSCAPARTQAFADGVAEGHDRMTRQG